MEGFPSSTELTAVPALAGAAMGHALFRMKPGEVAALRKKPGPIPAGWTRVPPALFRHADEQTIAGTAAVFMAIEALGASPDRFEAWGVVAASRYLGRANLAVALRSFMAEGVWGTSPHLIPHFALHSASGSISLGKPGLAWSEPGSRRRASCGCRRFFDGSDVAVDRRGAGCVARLERLVARTGARSCWQSAQRWRMPGSLPVALVGIGDGAGGSGIAG